MFRNPFKKNKVEEFWKWFSKNSELYFNFESNQQELFDILSTKLNSINENLTFEFSPVLKDSYREFVISADGIKDSFSIVKKLVEESPKLKDWKIIAFRQPLLDYPTIKYSGIEIDAEDVYFRYAIEEQKLGLELNIRNFEDNNEWINISYLMLDNIIGEYDTVIFIDWIERKKLIEEEVEILYNIMELPEIIKDLKTQIFGR